MCSTQRFECAELFMNSNILFIQIKFSLELDASKHVSVFVECLIGNGMSQKYIDEIGIINKRVMMSWNLIYKEIK